MWKTKDPMQRLKLFMEKKGLWTAQYQHEVEEKATSMIDEAVKTLESIEPPQPREMFTYIYEKLTPRQTKQLKDF